MNKTKKRIAVIGLKGLPAFGGAAAVGENLLAQLKDDYDFTVLSISSHTHLKTGEYNGVKQVVFKSFLGNGGLNTAWYYFVSMFYVLFHRFDIVHLHHLTSGFIIPIIKLRRKTILTTHGIRKKDDPKFNKILNYFGFISDKIAMICANQIVSVSKPDAEYLANLLNKQVINIPNGINTINHEVKENNQSILFSAGRIYNLKGLHLLIEAADKLQVKNTIQVVGDIDRVPHYKQEIIDKSKKLDINFRGLIKDRSELMSIINNAQLFVFPSLQEAMSMMLLEVASMKTPIIASDIPANTAIFTENEVLFFENNNANDLAEKIQYALDNPSDMKERADRAYEKLIEKYTWDKIAKQYIEIYEQI